ncbi:MAG TPA: hypothetical protein PLM81_10900 [Ginsengibacter sp.]|nr:hypothetical protein [Ginsengibacter sp.]
MKSMGFGKMVFLGIFFSFFLATAFGQSRKSLPVAVPVPDGVWIYLGNELPKSFTYIIERKKTAKGNYENVGEVKSPVSIAEMNSRQQQYQNHFSKLEPFGADEASRLWQYLSTHKTIDSSYSRNVPMTHLLAGTAFFDSKAEKGTDYQYRISIRPADGKSQSPAESNATAQFRKPEFPVIKFSTSQSTKDKVTIVWAVKTQMNMAHFNIYRSVFGKDNFERVSLNSGSASAGVYAENDSLKFILTDSIGNNPAWYEYKIAPVDPYGIEGSLQGLTNAGNIADYYAPPITNFRSVNTHQNHEIKLMWRLENKKYLNGITVMRSRNYDSGYMRIASLPVTDTVYTDIVPESGENFYYYLKLESADNTPLTSARIFGFYTDDQSLPEPPNEIDAVTAPNGITVYWKSEEPYANGFYVYRRKNTNEPFVQASPLIPVGKEVYSFSDTSKLLQGGEVYQYVVRSRNENNLLSRNSDTVSSTSGVKVVLTPPVNVRYRNNDGIITLIWDNMSSWDNDLMGYNVYRKAGNAAWQKVNKDSLDAARNFFVDSTVQPGISYSYAISSFDMYGNRSERSVIAIPVIAEDLLPPPPGIRVAQSDGSVYISWGQMEGAVSSIKIYRSEPGKQPVLVGTVDDGGDSFVDKNVSKGKLYFYQLSSLNKDKKEGEWSDKVGIRVQ